MRVSGEPGVPGLTLVEQSLNVEEYASLREAVGWWPVDPRGCRDGLARDLFCVKALLESRLVGCGRVVGDGGLYFYLQDVIVLPEHQGQQIGSTIVEALMRYVAGRARPGAFVALMAAKGLAPFYERWGFQRRPEEGPGMFRVWE